MFRTLWFDYSHSMNRDYKQSTTGMHTDIQNDTSVTVCSYLPLLVIPPRLKFVDLVHSFPLLRTHEPY